MIRWTLNVIFALLVHGANDIGDSDIRLARLEEQILKMNENMNALMELQRKDNNAPAHVPPHEPNHNVNIQDEINIAEMGEELNKIEQEIRQGERINELHFKNIEAQEAREEQETNMVLFLLVIAIICGGVLYHQYKKSSTASDVYSKYAQRQQERQFGQTA